MRKMFFVLAVLFAAAPAGEFLAIVRGVQPEEVAADFRVVGHTNSGVLVVGAEGSERILNLYQGRILDYNPEENVYYRVRLFEPAEYERLAGFARILDFDGAEYLVAVKPEQVERLLELRAFLGRVSLQGWVFRPVDFQPPPVFTDPVVEEIVARVDPDSVLADVRRLQRYRTRYSTSDSCRAAAEWIRQKLQAYGCDTVIMQYHTGGHAPNVIGIRYGTRGTRNPYAVICGHFDSYAPSNAPGADDNASGTAAVLEAARVTQGYRFGNDLRFIAFSGEEFGLYGSEYYAAQARVQGDSILGVLNFDMIGYVDAAPENLDLLGKISNPPCEPFVDWFSAVADSYAALPVYKRMVNDNQNSDHGPFWNNGYLAFCGIEDFWPVNPWYHTAGDSIGAGYNSNDFCTQVIRAGVAGLALLGSPLPANRPLLRLWGTRIDDTGGNGNGIWDAGESVGVYITVKNLGLVDAHSVQAQLSSVDSFITIVSDRIFLGDIPAGETVVSAQGFAVRAALNSPRGYPAEFDLTLSAAESTYQAHFTLEVAPYLITDPIPDNGEPPRYWAYDDIDTGWVQHPVYEWVEINSVGTRLVFPHNDSVRVVPLPPGFGRLRFYGAEFDSISISADGWLCPGFYRQPRYVNRPLPDTGTPPGIIAVNWDDLYPDYNNSGFVYYHYDADRHRLIVEYDSVCYFNPRSLRDKFEVLIYDSTVSTPTGDNVIVFQYQTANRYTSSTVGIQDPGRRLAIQCLYDSSYHRAAAPIAPGRAICFTTAAATALEDGGRADTRRVLLCPNPVRGLVRLNPAHARSSRIEVYDLTGRLRTSLTPGRDGSVYWDTRLLPNGVYFIRRIPGSRVSRVVVIN